MHLIKQRIIYMSLNIFYSLYVIINVFSCLLIPSHAFFDIRATWGGINVYILRFTWILNPSILLSLWRGDYAEMSNYILGVVKRNPLFFHSISCKNNGFLFTTSNISQWEMTMELISVSIHRIINGNVKLTSIPLFISYWDNRSL